MTNTPISTMTRPTTSTAYCAMATSTLGVLITSSSASVSPGALPEASCQDPVATSCLPFFFGRASLVSADSLAASATTDQEPGAAAGVAGRIGSTGGGVGSDGAGAGVQTSLGLGVSAGAGVQTSSTGGGGASGGAYGAGAVSGGGNVGVAAGGMSQDKASFAGAGGAAGGGW